MEYLFHQNMRLFGGGSFPRNFAYNIAFGAIAATIPMGSRIAVAGFTEVVNNGAAAATLGGGGGGFNLCGQLGTTLLGLVSCGRTALANGPEFVGIGVAPGVTIHEVGRILLNSYGRRITLIHQVAPLATPFVLPVGVWAPPAAFLSWAARLPPNASFDYRGLVYVVVTLNGVRVAVGFLHNLYTFEAQRVLVMNQLAPMAALLLFRSPAAPLHVYLGGDFNVRPINRGGPRTVPLQCYAAAAAVVPAGAIPGGTTWHGNLYDYWYSDVPNVGPAPPGLVIPVPSVNPATLQMAGIVKLSDHTAILLRMAP